MSAPRDRLCRHDASRPRLGRSRAAAQGFRVRRLSMPTPRASRDSQAGQLPVVEPDLDDLPRATAASHGFQRRSGAICAPATSSTSRPTCRPTISGRATSPAFRRTDRAGARRRSGRTRCSWCCARCRRASRARRRSSGRVCYYQVETLVFGRAVERATKPERYHRRLRRIRRGRCRQPMRRCSAPSAARSCRCATRAPSWPRSRSTAASSPRSPSPTRWPNCASASAPTGPRSRRR